MESRKKERATIKTAEEKGRSSGEESSSSSRVASVECWAASRLSEHRLRTLLTKRACLSRLRAPMCASRPAGHVAMRLSLSACALSLRVVLAADCSVSIYRARMFWVL